jgi:hypothetical protein
MTRQELARHLKWFLGFFYLSFGLLYIALLVYSCFVDHRAKTVAFHAMQIPVAMIFVLDGGKRIYDCRRAV